MALMNAVYWFVNRKNIGYIYAFAQFRSCRMLFCDLACQMCINKALRKTERKLERSVYASQLVQSFVLAIWGKLVSQFNQSSNLPLSNCELQLWQKAALHISRSLSSVFHPKATWAGAANQDEMYFYLFIYFTVVWWLPDYRPAALQICRYPTDLTPVLPINLSTLLHQ